jgi:hypothetical protein
MNPSPNIHGGSPSCRVEHARPKGRGQAGVGEAGPACENVFVPFSRIADRRIREAIAQGEFENLPGSGKPLNLEEYFNTPEDLRMAFSILKNANCAPAEVELLNEVSRLQRAIAAASDAATRQELQRTLVSRRTELAIALERRSPRER